MTITDEYSNRPQPTEDDSEVEYPHYMYDCETGERYTANNQMEHDEYDSLGYVHSLNECASQGIIYVPPPGSDDADDAYTPPDELDYIQDEEVEEVEVVQEDETEFTYTPPLLPIDPSGDDDVISIIQDYDEEKFIWEEVPLPNMDSSPAIFGLTTAGNVDVNSERLYAESDETTSSEFFLRAKEGTRVTFAVRLEYDNKAIDRSPLSPSDWAEEFDLILEDGDSIKWDVPRQESANAYNLYSIDNPQDGMLSIVVNGNERIDQSSPFQTYHEVEGIVWRYRARGEMSIRLELIKYEVKVGVVIEDPDDPEEEDPPTGGSGGGSTLKEIILDPDDLFQTSDIMLGLGVMLLLGIYVLSRLDIDASSPVPAVA